MVSINRDLSKIMKTMKIPKLLLAIGSLSALFFSPCNGQKTNAPPVTDTNRIWQADGFQSFKIRDPGPFSLSNPNTQPPYIILPHVEEVKKTFSDGSKYVGEAMNGKPDGQGTLTSPNGSNQHGEWRDGLEYRIEGTWVGPDGTREEGTWNRDGTKSGGEITWKDGRTYKGEWKLVSGSGDLPDGKGWMKWPDGRKYEGQFKDGKMEGTGKMTYRSGRIEEGLWKADKFIGTASATAGSAGTK